MKCAKCGESFAGAYVSLKCYDILYNEKKDLEKENARLKAKLHNIDEGLKRLEAFMMDGPDRSIDPVNRDGVAVLALVDGCGECEMHAPTLSLLIDKILTGGK